MNTEEVTTAAAVAAVAYAVKPLFEAGGKAVQTGISIIEKISNPVAEQIGLFLEDKAKVYRTEQFISVLRRWQKKKLDANVVPDNMKINPRLMLQIYENSSVVEDDTLQEMWAGLIVQRINTGCRFGIFVCGLGWRRRYAADGSGW